MFITALTSARHLSHRNYTVYKCDIWQSLRQISSSAKRNGLTPSVICAKLVQYRRFKYVRYGLLQAYSIESKAAFRKQVCAEQWGFARIRGLVLFVCKCVLYCCHRVSIQLQLISIHYHIYHISHHITYIVSYIIYHTYHISYHTL